MKKSEENKKKKIKCTRCSGVGEYQNSCFCPEETCEVCNGRGYVTDKKLLEGVKRVPWC